MSDTDSKRDATGAWKPGGPSPNPGGVPKMAREMRKYALAHCQDAIDRLVEWMHCDDGKYSIPACQAILDRGLGKAKEHVEIEHIVDDRRALDQMERLRADPKTIAALLTLAEAVASEPQVD